MLRALRRLPMREVEGRVNDVLSLSFVVIDGGSRDNTNPKHTYTSWDITGLHRTRDVKMRSNGTGV